MKSNSRIHLCGPFAWLALIVSTACIFGSYPALAAVPDYWQRADDGTIFHETKEGLPPVVICMQGRKVVMQSEIDPVKGYSHKVRFFNVPAGRTDKGKAIFDEKKGRASGNSRWRKVHRTRFPIQGCI